MQYDPVKNIMSSLIRKYPFVRNLFFITLDLLFLRQWYIKKKMKYCYKTDAGINFYDAGAGFCQYSEFVLKHWKYSSVFALDLKGDYLEDYALVAKRKYQNRFSWIRGDLVLFKPAQKFNLIAAIDILEHIEDDRQVLKNFYNCLEPGGKLVISTPSDLDEVARFTEEHVRPGYAPDDLKTKLIDAGFCIKSFEFSYGKWGKTGWYLSMKIPLQVLSLSKMLIVLLPFYYLCVYPLIFVCMIIDLNSANEKGNGIIAVAEKES